MRTILTRARWIAAGLILGAVVTLFAQEPARFERGIEIIRGNLSVGTGSLIFEGATGDAFEMTISSADVTADRTWTVPDSASDTFVGLAATQTLTNKTFTTPTFTSGVTAAGATETLTSADCGQTTLLDTAAGSVVTLPAATGSGCMFTFIVTTSVTSNSHQINVVGNDEFVGGLASIGTTADQADAFTAADAGDTDRIDMNGTTTGGLLGTIIVIQDASADNWALWGTAISTDASATMLATGAVS